MATFAEYLGQMFGNCSRTLKEKVRYHLQIMSSIFFTADNVNLIAAYFKFILCTLLL